MVHEWAGGVRDVVKWSRERSHFGGKGKHLQRQLPDEDAGTVPTVERIPRQ